MKRLLFINPRTSLNPLKPEDNQILPKAIYPIKEKYSCVHEFSDETENEVIWRTAQNIDDSWKPETRSMMVGDLIHSTKTDELFLCVICGFEKVESPKKD